jgi:hypothetical protein
MNTLAIIFLTFLAFVANMALEIPANHGKSFTTVAGGIVNSGVEGTLTELTIAPQKTGGGIYYSIQDIPIGPEFMTFTVVNKHTASISTTHVVGAGAPTAVSGPVGAGTIAPNASSSFAVPLNWTGNVAVIDAAYSITGDVSLIEANYVQNWDWNSPVTDVDISYV